ncbi:hypothetical protein L1049_006460 [Liquidambar formosana]|uniref:NAC domain-containing protein n=1 Tax=Liquidambar formosana TaxID=63359 RepID=A0AAP0WR16_LIQFO
MAILDVFTFSNSSSVHEEKRQGGGGGGEEESLASSVREGGWVEEELNLPLGYRFRPTACELIIYYLVNKIFGRQLPANIIRDDIDVYKFNPDQLPVGEFKYGKTNEAYFFTDQKSTRPRRTTEDGYWKATGEDVEIYCGDAIVGFKKILVFHWGKAPRGRNSSWIMHEYRINPETIPVDLLNDQIKSEKETYVVCRVKHKEYIGRKHSRAESSIESPDESTTSDEEENQIDSTEAKVLLLSWDGSAQLEDYIQDEHVIDDYSKSYQDRV